jgi:choline dehydrogenase-like flavoprotein
MKENVIGPTDYQGDLRVTCDVVVIGSGAGGATAAATLAEAGLEVICLEEGGFHRTADYSADIAGMFRSIMRNGGATATLGRSPVPYLEGRCVGGSTVINGGMCWRTPPRILETWARERGLPDLAPERLEPLFDEVERIIHARYQDAGSEGENNDVFLEGATRLGWKLSKNKRNQVHCVGSNDCVTGCPSGAKQSTIFTWLPRLWANGGVVHTHCRATRLLTDRGRVVGVTGDIVDHPGGRRFTVKARAVVLAGGAVQTPLLLLRSKLGGACGQVGRHFTIHPNIKVAARFDRPVDSVRGAHQAWQCVEFEDDGVLMAPGLVPIAFRSVAFNDFGPRLAQRMRDHGHVATGGILVDDHASGRIQLLPMGIPLVRYDVTDHDQARFVRGAARLAEIYFAAGAKEVFLPFHGIAPLRSPDDLARLLASKPRPEDTEYFTAHLMGTCRMDAHPKRGVVDPDGQMWDAPGLYLADASIMPSTIGVNPQVTIMALARLVSMRLAERLTARAAA